MAGCILSGRVSRTGGQQEPDHTRKGRGEVKGGTSQLQPTCTALMAIVDTGNIAGVAMAPTAGGPGVLLWIWVSALTGMVVAYAETMLGTRYRYKDNEGHYVYGPLVYIGWGLGIKGIEVLYSSLCLMCSLGMSSMVWADFAISTMEYVWQIPALAGGLVFTGTLTPVIYGGISRIGDVVEKLVPAAPGIYIIFSLIMIFSCLNRIPAVLASMASLVFCLEVTAGGGVGYVVNRSIRYGMPRGALLSGAGLGILAVLHGLAEDTTPHEQGMWATLEVFFDTVILYALIALVTLCMTGSAPETVPYQGVVLVVWYLGGRLGFVGEYLVSGSTMVFVFVTIMVWFYLGGQAVAYFVSGAGLEGYTGCKLVVKVYPLLFPGVVLLGSEARLDVVWMLSDIWNRLTVLPNLTALLFLSREMTLPEGFHGGLGKKAVGGKTTL